jgi:hypothetical protein
MKILEKIFRKNVKYLNLVIVTVFNEYKANHYNCNIILLIYIYI